MNWGALGVEVVLECTGIFRSKEKAQAHIDAGAEWVVISAPGTNVDLTVVMGVNDDLLDPAQHKIVSNGSCTTNCLAPVVKVIDDAFGVEHGLMTTIHSYTNDQALLDAPHKNKRSVFTASSEQVRNPIHSKSLRGWKKYEDLLKPALELISKNRDLKRYITQ